MRAIERSHTINFIDENDRYVGFDTIQSCCESFGWGVVDSITEEPDDLEGMETPDYLPGYIFDQYFQEELDWGGRYLDAGGAVAFRLINLHGGEEKYLVLWCAHNGYYSHGFAYNFLGYQEEGAL